jgi:hypothetical protein
VGSAAPMLRGCTTVGTPVQARMHTQAYDDIQQNNTAMNGFASKSLYALCEIGVFEQVYSYFSINERVVLLLCIARAHLCARAGQ